MDVTNKGSITVETTIKAPVENVWKAWTDPSLILKWFGSDPNGLVLEANLDVRPGGSFNIMFVDSDLTRHTCSGVYNEVQEFNKLTFSWTWESEPGVESFVTILFAPEGKFTRMQFEHAHVGNASKHDYLSGWKTTFTKLEQLLSSGMEK